MKQETETSVITTPSTTTSPADTLDDNASGSGSAADEVVVDIKDSGHGATGDEAVVVDINDDVIWDSCIRFDYVNQIIKKKDFNSLRALGGAQEIAKALSTHDFEININAISSDDGHQHRRRMAAKLWRLLKSSTFCCYLLSIVSLILILVFSFMGPSGLGVGLLSLIMIVFLVLLRFLVPYVCDLWNKIKVESDDEREILMAVVDVTRGGAQLENIPVSEILLGDIVCLKIGSEIPGDGLFVHGDSLELDDGSELVNKDNPFLFYGSQVINGEGGMFITSVGPNNISTIGHDIKKKWPLDNQFEKLMVWKTMPGLTVIIVSVVAMYMRYRKVKSKLPDLKAIPSTITNEKLSDFFTIFKRFSMRNPVPMLVAGVLDGLPLGNVFACVYRKRKGFSFADQSLGACVAMGSVTTICVEVKAVGLTWEPLEVAHFFIGEDEITQESAITMRVRETLIDGISTSLLVPKALRTAEEEPLLSWAVQFKFFPKLETMRRSTTIEKISQYSSNFQEEIGVLLRKKNSNIGGVDASYSHWRGIATKILPRCSHYYDNKGQLNAIDKTIRESLERSIEEKMQRDLRVIAFAYKQTVVAEVEETNLILAGLIVLKKSNRTDIQVSIEACRNAGAKIILVSRDNPDTLVKIARNFGILPRNHTTSTDQINCTTITGQEFNDLTDEERMVRVSNGLTLVMGNASPSDKLLLVKCLKKKNEQESVAFIGVGADDVPALKEADVGLVMEAWSSDLARESADIVIKKETNLSFLKNLLMYGRCILNNIQKYNQLDLTMTYSGVLTSGVSAIWKGDTPITIFYTLWANLLAVVVGGFPLLIESSPAEEYLMDQVVPAGREKNKKKSQQLITNSIWRNLLCQVIYQSSLNLALFHFEGKAIPGINVKIDRAFIGNIFVMCQFFNRFNAREPVRKNVFRAIHKSHVFCVTFVITLLLQMGFIILFEHHKTWMDLGLHCCISLVIGMISWLIDWAEKSILGFIKD